MTTSTSSMTLSAPPRLGRFFERRDADDLPFYDGDPITVSSGKWLVVIASCVVGFFVLALMPAADDISGLVPRVLFAAIPLATFIAVTGRHWTRLFRRPSWRDVGATVFFAVANLVVSAAIALVVQAVFGANANPATTSVLEHGPANVVAFYAGTGIQLVGEELFTILPFLALVFWLSSRAGVSRNTAIIIAWVATAIWFGAAHLPTYGWNVAQAILVIGGARLVLTLAYLRTKNLGVSIGAHILNDWVQFTVALLVAGAGAGVALF